MTTSTLPYREISRRILLRYVLTSRRRTWAFDGFDDTSAPQAAWNVGVYMGVASTDHDLPDWASSLAYHLTAHTMATTSSHRYIVTASLGDQHAAVSVIALRGRVTGTVDPADRDAIRHLAPRSGCHGTPAGPMTYAVIHLPTPGPLKYPRISDPG